MAVAVESLIALQELGNGLAAATSKYRRLLRGVQKKYLLYGAIKAAAEYGASTQGAAELKQQSETLQKELEIKDKLIAELWKGLDVQQKSYEDGYADALAGRPQRVASGVKHG